MGLWADAPVLMVAFIVSVLIRFLNWANIAGYFNRPNGHDALVSVFTVL
jgi:hypothetical protein